MASAPAMAAEGIRWDLSALFSGIDDPRIEPHWQALHARADEFEAKFRGKLSSPDLTAGTLLEALQEAESIASEASKPINLAHLNFAVNASDPAIGAFLQKQMEHYSSLSVKLLFAELELQKTPDDTIKRLLGDRILANYKHYIGLVRALSPYSLTEAEEVILEETSNTGSRAWTRLFDEITANQVYRINVDGNIVEASEQEVLDLLRDPDRTKRQAAADAFTEGLLEMQRVLAFTFNNLLQDKAVEDRLRSLSYPEQRRHLSNELDRETVNLVIKLCRDHYELVARYYRVKREILGLSELTHIDRYAPLFESEESVDWETAKGIVLESFGKFSEELEIRAREFFDNNWIDAEPRKGKTGGAFCSYNTPDTHPVVMQSFMGKLDDVMTLAHELGHGVHASLSRAQTYFNFHGTLPLAELASTFGEMLVFEKLVASASDKDRLALYADKIEGVFATVFRQAAMFTFEQRVHASRREEGEQTPEQIGAMWQEEIQAMFGDSLKLGDQHRSWWSYVSHFVQAPFYVYAYSIGELLVLSLYQKAKREGNQFAAQYVELLRLGGSLSPKELMETVGIDLQSEEFWRGGFAAIEELISSFEKQWQSYRA
jgi:oligoendopeptidase F